MRIHPLQPVGRVTREHVTSQDAITAGVLDVDVQVAAEHGDHDIEVDLQVMRNPFFHAEQVGFMATVPATEFGEGEQEREEEEDQRCVATSRGAAGVGGFGFC